MNTLIFGGNGQDGLYMQRLLRQRGETCIAVHRSGVGETEADIVDYAVVERLLRIHKPARIFHFAANSTTRHSALFENHATISTGTLNILEAVKAQGLQSKVFITGSGVQFLNQGLPISEADPFAANSAYAIARIQSVYAARYFRSLGIPVYVGYLFHHESPERKASHVAKMIAEAVRRIARGSTEKISLGDISVRKEWSFAGDIVEGMDVLMQQDDVFEATIGSGQGFSISDWLQACFELINCDWQDHVVTQSNFVPEYKCLISNPATMSKLGWRAETDLQTLARLMVRGGR
jgi:GDPmannose 4,6-dehydratase